MIRMRMGRWAEEKLEREPCGAFFDEFTMTTSDRRIAGVEGSGCEPKRTCPGTDFEHAGRHQVRAQGRERVGALPFHELPAAVLLPVALGVVDADRVARDVPPVMPPVVGRWWRARRALQEQHRGPCACCR